MPKAIQVIKEEGDALMEISKSSLRQLLASLAANKIYLNKNGIVDKEKYDDTQIPNCINNIKQAFNEINQICDRKKGIIKYIGSYGAKHNLERYRASRDSHRDNYISNGEFIAAMCLLGFKIQPIPETPNVWFNAKFISKYM